MVISVSRVRRVVMELLMETWFHQIYVQKRAEMVIELLSVAIGCIYFWEIEMKALNNL